MPLPISLPYTFANATAAIPLSQLDTDLTTLKDGINGIGNGTNALSNVTITGGSIANVSLSTTNGSLTITGGSISLSNGFGYAWGNTFISGSNAGSMNFFTNNTEKMRIETSGNVGIGTTSINGRLSVDGGGIYAAAGSASSVAYGFYPSATYGNTGMFSPGANTVAFATTGGERMRIDSSGYVGIGTTAPTQALTVAGAVGYNAPVTVTSATYSVGITDNFIIANRAGTVTLTLPTASSYTGRILYIKTVQAQAVVSAASNVVPLNSTTAGTAILAATAGAHAMLVSNGTNWVIMNGG